MTEQDEMFVIMKNAYSAVWFARGKLSGFPESAMRERWMAELERAGQSINAVVVAESLYPRQS